jgi:hypothetical protein
LSSLPQPPQPTAYWLRTAGDLYVLEFSDGSIKVGHANEPAKRVVSSAKDIAARCGVSLTQRWAASMVSWWRDPSGDRHELLLPVFCGGAAHRCGLGSLVRRIVLRSNQSSTRTSCTAPGGLP